VSESDGSILKRLLGGGARQIAAFTAQMFTLPVIAHFLPGPYMGAWALLGATGFLIGFADLGLATAVQRSAVKEDHDRTRRLMGLALLVQTLLLPVLLVVAYLYFSDIPDASAEVRRQAALAILAVLAGGAALALGQPYRMYVLARGGVGQVANARTVAGFVQLTVILVGFFGFGMHLLVPALGFLANNTVDFVLTAWAARGLDRQLPLTPRRPVHRGQLRSAFADGGAAFALNVSVSAGRRINLFVLSWVAPLAMVGTYQVAGRAVDIAYLLAKQTTTAIMRDLGKPDVRERAVRIGTAVFGGIVVSGMAAMALVGQPLLVALFDEHAAGEAAQLILFLLATAAVVMSLYEVTGSMVMLGGRTAWGCAVPIVVGSVINLAISISLAPRYGIWAVAGSTVVGNTITFVLMWRQGRRLLDWPLSRVAGTLGPSLAALVTSVGLGLLLRPYVDHWAVSLGACVGVMGAGLAVMALIVFLRRGRETLVLER